MGERRNDMGVADLSRERSRLRIAGADRVTFLHGQCTNDVKRLRVGESCYAAFLNAKGKMRGDGYVVCLEDSFLVEASVGLLASLEKFIITEDVTIEDVSGVMGEWLAVGSGYVALPAGAVTFAHALGTGVIGPAPMTATLSREELESVRVEAGLPWWGVDMDENTIPVEAGLEARAISYEKGCYIGQETIARIRMYGHVNRQLVQLSLGGSVAPSRGDGIVAGGPRGGTGHERRAFEAAWQTAGVGICSARIRDNGNEVEDQSTNCGGFETMRSMRLAVGCLTMALVLLKGACVMAQGSNKVAVTAQGGDEVAVIETKFGKMAIEFYDKDAPKTVANFKKLAKEGFYNGTTFHRIMQGFMIQGGDPLSKTPDSPNVGTGGPAIKSPPSSTPTSMSWASSRWRAATIPIRLAHSFSFASVMPRFLTENTRRLGN